MVCFYLVFLMVHEDRTLTLYSYYHIWYVVYQLWLDLPNRTKNIDPAPTIFFYDTDRVSYHHHWSVSTLTYKDLWFSKRKNRIINHVPVFVREQPSTGGKILRKLCKSKRRESISQILHKIGAGCRKIWFWTWIYICNSYILILLHDHFIYNLLLVFF